MNGDVVYMLASDLSVDVGLLGLVLVFFLFILVRKYSEAVLSFFGAVLSLAVGVYYLGNSMFSILWWIGIIGVFMAVYFSFFGLFFVATGRYYDKLKK